MFFLFRFLPCNLCTNLCLALHLPGIRSVITLFSSLTTNSLLKSMGLDQEHKTDQFTHTSSTFAQCVTVKHKTLIFTLHSKFIHFHTQIPSTPSDWNPEVIRSTTKQPRTHRRRSSPLTVSAMLTTSNHTSNTRHTMITTYQQPVPLTTNNNILATLTLIAKQPKPVSMSTN